MEWMEITVKVPKEFIQDAEEFGLSDPAVIAQVLRDELDQQRIMNFVNKEVKAYRDEQRAKRAE